MSLQVTEQEDLGRLKFELQELFMTLALGGVSLQVIEQEVIDVHEMRWYVVKAHCIGAQHRCCPLQVM